MESLNPSWLDNAFLLQVLQSVEPVEDAAQEMEVIKYQCHHVVPPGDNYLSQLFRISVKYKTDKVKTASLIVKTPLDSGFVLEIVEKISGYKNEIKIYNEILPKMYALHNLRVSARPFFCPLENSLVLEDLKENGYKMADRLQQLDFAHCQCFLKTLAGLHALSVAVQEAHPELLEEFRLQWFFNSEVPEETQQMMKEQTETQMKNLIKVVEKLDGCEHYVGMFRKVSDSYWVKMCESMKPGNGLFVLNHGDTWTNNIMFKYNDSGDVLDAKLIDFQMCNLKSFAFDIILFWWTSANEEVREHHRAELFEIYRQTLNRILAELQSSIFLLKEDFDFEIKSKAPFAISVVQTLLGVAMADPHDLPDFTTVDSPESFAYSFSKNYSSKYYLEVLPTVLRQIEEFGAFQ